ncbi:hypothetical protein C173_20511 [Paenibacillus sp. FSL R7-277]|uniref:hypothetical protein n=1 Tax=unclassified Paenibacillus TaxID=185978 RepID=UPI0003E1D878|nr:hypothetical protein [Paenibacillus sp. FSL R7-277]ETT65448.1 hypothetical protein C173_20511 [Paenibacillus sp. FSL R7-277]
MIKKLPLGESPIIGYQHHAYPLSISSLHPSFYDWFYCNYIQLYCNNDTPQFNLNFYEFSRLNPKSPLLEEMYLPKTFIFKYADPMRFLIDSISNDHYIVTFVDEFYIPNRSAYRKFHNVHDILLYGFDETKGVLDVAGFNAKMQYGYSQVNLRDFEQAFIDIKTSDGYLVRWANGMHLFQVKFEKSFHFNLKITIELMQDYLLSRNTSIRFRMYDDPSENIYGVDVYDSVVQYLRKSTDELDIRPLHIIYEHKKCMVSRLKYLLDTSTLDIPEYLINEYCKIEQDALKARNIGLKYQMNKNPVVLEHIVNVIEEVREREIRTLSEVIQLLTEIVPQ